MLKKDEVRKGDAKQWRAGRGRTGRRPRASKIGGIQRVKL